MMPINRDDFTEKTKIIMAQRVGYKCTNPDCRKLTSGPHSNPEKSILVGVAAHITAASMGGPRYDPKLTEEERKHITNGIWLCATCSTLIDKDEMKFPQEMLNEWKTISEDSTSKELQMKLLNLTPTTTSIPFLELDLIWSGKGKRNMGISSKNHNVYRGPIEPGQAIWYNTLFWNFDLAIYNNSSFPAFNIKIIEPQDPRFSYLDKLPTVNNIKPLGDIELNAKYEKYFEGTGREAMKLIEPKIPPEFIGKEIIIEYGDEARNIHTTKSIITENGITNRRIN